MENTKKLKYPGMRADISRCNALLHELCQIVWDRSYRAEQVMFSIPPVPRNFDMQFSAAFDELSAYRAIGDVEELTALAKARDEGRVVVLPCKVGDTVYSIAPCGEIWMCFDDDYDTGTGATECPFENTCDIEECDDNHIRIFETKCSGFGFEENGRILVFLGGLTVKNNDTCWGKTVFLTRAEAEAALNEKAMDKCKTCSHNLDKNELGCDRLRIGVSETDGNGVVYTCEDYEAVLKGGNQNAT